MKKNNKAQTFSTDIIIVIVIILFGTLFLVINKINDVQSSSLEEIQQKASDDTSVIYNSLKSSKIINEENIIDADLLVGLDEEELRDELGIENEFAISFEKDGKLVKIGNKNCVGSSNIIINDEICE